MRLLASELLKIRTAPRTVVGLLLAELAIVAIGTASTIDSSNNPAPFEKPLLERDLISAVGSSLLFALILGVLMITWEYRHGTITQTLLVTPVRERVIAAKLIVGGLAGAALVIPALLLMLVIAEIWVGDRLHFGLHELQLIGRVFLGAAIVVAFAWGVFAEPALSIWGSLQPYLPIHALEGVLGTTESSLTFGRGLLTIAAYIVLLGALALGLTRRRDIT